MTIETCALCRAADGKQLVIDGVNMNTILGRSGAFLIVPALGPLVVGHVLVVSVKHKAGLRYLTSADQQDYERLRLQVRSYCKEFGDTLLEAEHGARDTSVRGPCIRHTHVHILPGLGEAGRLFDSNLACPVIEDGNVSAVDSYIWVNDGCRVTVYDGSRVIGQEIRHTIGRHLRLDDWDWGVNPKPELVARTIRYWSEVSRWLR